MLVLIPVIALLNDPFLSMASGPGDRFVAEIFRSEVVADGGATSLLRGGTVTDDAVAEMPGAGNVRLLGGRSPEGVRIVVLAPEPDGIGRDDMLCRISASGGGDNDNLQRAIGWCVSFLAGQGVTVELPPLHPPGAADRRP